MAALGLAMAVPFRGFSMGGAAPAPTYATWNPADIGTQLSLSNGDLTVTGGGSWRTVRATIGRNSGKPEFEVTVGIAGGTDNVIGTCTALESLQNYIGFSAQGWGYYGPTGAQVHNTAQTAFGASYGADVLTFSFDFTADTVLVKKNGASQGTFDISSLNGDVFFPAASPFNNGNTATLNAGQTALLYPETGYEGSWAQL